MARKHFKRKTGTGRFAKLPIAVLEHVSVRTLPHAAFRLLVLIAAAFNGFNNGALVITASQAEAAGIGSRHTFYAGLRELEGRGLIETCYPASRVPPRPTMYAVTWMPLNDTQFSRKTSTPTHAYRTWQPGGAA